MNLMKFVRLTAVATLCFWTFAFGQSSVSNVTFEQVHRLFGEGGSITDLYKEDEWERYRGLCVEWTGELTHLDRGLFGGINIGMRHLGSTLTYDVLMSAPTSEKDAFRSWRHGGRYTYRATLVRYGGTILPISADWGCEEK